MRASRDFFATRNLLTTDTFAEINIHVLPDFSRKVYVSKLQGDPQSLAKVVESIVRAGTDIGAQHGVSLNLALPLSAVNAQGQWVKDTPTPVGITLQFQPPQEKKA